MDTMNRQIKTGSSDVKQETAIRLEVLADAKHTMTGNLLKKGEVITVSRETAKEFLKDRTLFRIKNG